MFRHIAAFEWRYQLKSPVFWAGCLIFFLLAFGATTVDQIQIGSLGNVHKNSPFAILQTMGIMGVFAIFVTVALVAGVVVRDDETNFAPIIRTTSVGKTNYLVGRFVGATAAALIVIAMLPLAIVLGSCMPWQDIEKIGPFRPGDYAFALFAFALPTLLITAATFFAIATATRSMVWTYVAAVAVLVLWFVARGVARNDPALERIAAVIDPFGLSALTYATKYWTALERNTLLPAFSGLLLVNRLVWSGVALGVFALGYRLFRFEMRFEKPARQERVAPGAAKPEKLSRAEKAARQHAAELEALREANPAGVRVVLAADARRAVSALPDIPPATRATGRAQLWELAKVDMAFVFRSPAFFVLIAIGLINSGASLWFIGEIYGSPSWPVTRLMVQALQNSFSIFPTIIAVFYAGELVWRDRDRRMHEIVDATAAPDWVRIAPKVVAIVGVLLVAELVAVLAAVAVQASHGYLHFQIGAYLAWFVWPELVSAVLLAILAVFSQVLVPQKYLGWGVMLVYIVASVSLNGMGFEHSLYNYASTSPVPLSDMNGAGRFWIGQTWFQIYWLAFAALLLVASHLLWRRGATVAMRPRLAQARARLHGRPLLVAAVAAVVWIASGGWIFYNTNVLNPYLTSPDRDRLAADREKTLLPFETVVQPRIADVTLAVDLFPGQARAVTHGRYTLVNRSTQDIATLHVQWDQRLRLDAIDFAGAAVQTDYPRLHYRIYKLAEPLRPGERRVLGFTTTLEERGFPNSEPLTAVIENGSFVDNSEIAPVLGFSRHGLLEERAKRRKYGLPPELRPARLEDDAARANNELSHDSDWVDSDITVTTDADQTPIAPGRTLSDQVATIDGALRRTVHFKSDAPINQLFSIQSARYDVRRAVWHAPGRDVDLAVYYTPGHEFNVDRMLEAMRTSLALFDEKFSPYQFHQARIIEFPAYKAFAESFANTIPFSESIGFIQHPTDPEKIDIATYVTAHEIGHQWWGHQLVPADKQGAPFLTESFAQYSAMLVMERVYGHDAVRRFLKYELDRYLRARGGAVLEELPLNRVEDQDYIYYRKGSLAMYWAKEALGEEVVDRALNKMLAQVAFKGAPYPDSRDFLAILRAEAGPKNDALITDLFEKITLLDLKASNATATRRADGRYDVVFDVSAKKFYADGSGRETEAPMDEQVELGVFTAEPGRKGFGAKDVLVLDKRRIETGMLHVSLVVDRAPRWVGIDPYNKRIDRNSDDNLTAVDLK